MQSAVNGLAILSFLAMLIMLFGFASVLRSISELQHAYLQGTAGVLPKVHGASDGSRLLLVVSTHCTGCQERVADLNRRLSKGGSEATSGPKVLLLSSDPQVASWATSPKLGSLIDPEMLGSLGVSTTPTAIYIDRSGHEKFRRIVGSERDLDEVLTEASQLDSVAQ